MLAGRGRHRKLNMSVLFLSTFLVNPTSQRHNSGAVGRIEMIVSPRWTAGFGWGVSL